MKKLNEKILVRITGIIAIFVSVMFLRLISFLLVLGYQDSGSNSIKEFILKSFASLTVTMDTLFEIFNVFMLVFLLITGILAIRLKHVSRRLMLLLAILLIVDLIYTFLVLYLFNVLFFATIGIFILWILYFFNRKSIKLLYKLGGHKLGGHNT